MLGEVPEGWTRVELSEVVKKIRNGTPADQSDLPVGPPVTRIETISDGSIDLERVKYLSDCEAVSEYLLHDGDILFSHINSAAHIGKTAMYEGKVPLYHGMNLLVVRANPSVVVPRFLHSIFQLSSSRVFYRSRCKKAINQASLSTRDVGALQVFVPPLPEQRKIVAILSSVDEAIQATQAVIEQTRRVKEGLLQELLTKGIGHTRFKQTEIGEIPAAWEVRRLGELLRVQGGYAFSSKYARGTGARWLKIANVGPGEISWETESFLPAGFAAEYPDFVLSKGDIVMAMTRPLLGRMLKVAKVDRGGSLLNQRVGRLNVGGESDRSWVFNLIQSSNFIDAIERLIGGTDPPNISSRQLESILVAVPPLAEQQSIGSVLSRVTDAISSGLQSVAGLNSIKAGLLEDLLTGKVRVSV